MTREEHLAFCKKCTNRQFDPQQGIICSLTEKKADFEESCPDYNLDVHVKETVHKPSAEQQNHEVIKTIIERLQRSFEKPSGFRLRNNWRTPNLCFLCHFVGSHYRNH